MILLTAPYFFQLVICCSPTLIFIAEQSISFCCTLTWNNVFKGFAKILFFRNFLNQCVFNRRNWSFNCYSQHKEKPDRMLFRKEPIFFKRTFLRIIVARSDEVYRFKSLFNHRKLLTIVLHYGACPRWLNAAFNTTVDKPKVRWQHLTFDIRKRHNTVSTSLVKITCIV